MNHPFAQRRLGDILLGNKYIAREVLEKYKGIKDGEIGEYLLRENIINESQLYKSIAEQLNAAYVELDKFIISPDLFKILPGSIVYQFNVIPYKFENNTLLVVTSDPFDMELTDKIERITGYSVELLIGAPSGIKATLKRSEGTSEVLRDVSREFKPTIVDDSEDYIDESEAANAGESALAPVVRLINSILIASMQKRASDIHIETYERGITVKYRIDGVLYSATEVLDQSHHSALISRLKVMAELDIAEKRVPQDGRFKMRLRGRDVDFRVSILPGIYGEDVVIRILDKESITNNLRQLNFESLGLESSVVPKLKRSINEPYGMVLIAGPTGSGKTTTLYAALTELNTGHEKIITIEDPVEYQLDGVVQIPVNEKKNLTFAKGLRSILRHDPDKIMVGEIRDTETAQIAVQSALTGHLVFATVHANNAFDIISRFSHMGIDAYSFVSALNCVMAQRLVRKNCSNCKKEVSVDDELLELSGLDPKEYVDQLWYEGEGCAQCGQTGYYGRTVITEFLDLTLKMREMIIERRPESELQAYAVENGMTSLRQSALLMAKKGETSLQEINRITFVE